MERTGSEGSGLRARGIWTSLGKGASRQRGALAGAGALVLMAVTLGLTAWRALRRTEQEDVAQAGAALSVLAALNVAWLAALSVWAVYTIRHLKANARRAAEEALRECALREEGAQREQLERAAAAERLNRLTAEDALREKDDQLRQAQKLDAVGRLASGLAHDFNNLLTVILSYAELLAVDLSPVDPMFEGLDEIRRAGERAASLTQQLLAFSSTQRLSPTKLDLDQVISGMLKMLRRLIGAGIDLTHVPSGALAHVHVDRGQIEQVLLNLVVNARDAMPGGGSIVIRTTAVELDEDLARRLGLSAGPHVAMTVKDTGTGMDGSTLTRIFEPFFTTKEMGKGTGLGLAVVFGIVKQSGGQVAVTSIVGRGTTFTIYFPRLSSPEASATAPEPKIVPGGGSETILVVEDEEQVRTLACAVLRREGYHVLDAASGGDALLACEQHAEPIHLLLTDVVLPRISGERLSERLTDLRPSMKVLYMSGHSDDSISARTAGGQPPAFLPKPLTRESLLRKVREVLDGVVGTPSRDLKARRESALRLERRRSRTGPFERYPQDPL